MDNVIYEYRKGVAHGLNLATQLADQAGSLKAVRSRINSASTIASRIWSDGGFTGNIRAEIRRQLQLRGCDAIETASNSSRRDQA
jgi:hypothetical protein